MKKNLTTLIFFCISFYSQAQTQIPDQLGPRTALDIDGQRQFIDAGTQNRNIANEVTLEVWVRTREAHHQWLVGKQDASTGFHLGIQNGKAIFGGAGGISKSSGPSQTVVNDNKWHHLAGTFKAGNWEIWVDGILENSSISSGTPIILTGNAPLMIARNQLDSAQYLKGFIGEIKLWNTARTENQIRTFMARVVNLTTPELVGYFRCDSHVNIPSAQDKLKDLSGLQLHGQANMLPKYTYAAPPIGDESCFYYGTDLKNKSFKSFGDYEDTITIRNFTGNAKGIHLYKSGTLILTTGFLPPKNFSVLYYFGILSVGDTAATFQVKFSQDSTFFGRRPVLYTRTDSRKNFAKIRPGVYKPGLDTTSQYMVKERGELTYIFPCPSGTALNVFANDTIAKCPENRPTTLRASIGYDVVWSTGARTRSIQVNQTGKYWVRLRNPCGEIGSDTFRVVIAPPVKLPVLKTADTLICDNAPLILKMPKGYDYLWPGGSTVDTFAITAAGTYQVTTTNPRCGNSVSSSIKVRTVACSPEKVFIPNIITPNNDGLNDFFAPVGLTSGQYGLTIYNRWGKPVYQSFSYKNNWQAEGLSGGIYYYFFQNAASAKTYKGYIEVVR